MRITSSVAIFKSCSGTVLPLPQAAIDIIEARDQVVDNPFVFAGRAHGQPFNSCSQGKAELDARLPKDMGHVILVLSLPQSANSVS